MNLSQASVLSGNLLTSKASLLDLGDEFVAARCGNVETLKRLIEEEDGSSVVFHGGVESNNGIKSMNSSRTTSSKVVTRADSLGFTVLHHAVYNNEKATVELLVKHGAVADAISFYIASMQGHLRILKAFLEEGLASFGRVDNKGNSNSHSQMNSDANNNRTEREQTILNAGLLAAAIHNRPVCAAYLLNFGADPLAISPLFSPDPSSSRTTVHWAAFYGNAQVLGIMLQQQRRRDIVNITDAQGMTPLHLAGMKGHGEACSALLSGGATLDMKDNMNRTAHEIAREYQQTHTAVYLKHVQDQKEAESADKTKRRAQMKKHLSIGYYYVWGQYLCNLYCHFVIFFILYPNYPSTFLLSSAITLYFFENYCYYKASRSDPGFLPSQRHNDDATPPLPIADLHTQVRLCETCNIFRPLRSKHCAVCDRCVQKFDHHCVWINNCVGRYNHKWFLGYVFFFGLDILQLWVHIYLYISSTTDTPSGLSFLWWMITNQPNIALVGLISTIFGLMVEGLCVTHSIYVFSNMTTNEAMNFRRYEYFRHPQDDHFYNPFNQGTIRNILDFFQLGSHSLDYTRVFTPPEVSLINSHNSNSNGNGHAHSHGPNCNHSHGHAHNSNSRSYEVV